MIAYRFPMVTAPSRRIGQEETAPKTVQTYSGVPGVIETLGVLAISSAAAWVGIRTGMNKSQKTVVRAAGYVGGIGSGIIGLLYLGGKTGVTQGLPQVVIVPQNKA